MKLWLSIKNKEKSEFKTDFFPTLVVQTPTLFLLTYKFDTSTWIIKESPVKYIQTDNFSVFHLTRLHHVIYGHFEYNGKKYEGQLGCYLRQVGAQGFDHVLIFHEWDDIIFENSLSSILMQKADYLVLDLEDFNKSRKLIGQDEYSFNEYVAKKLSKSIADENGLTIQDETTLFSIFTDKFDASNLMSSKGMSIFLEEQAKKENT